MKTPQIVKPAAVPFGDSCIVLDVRTDVEHADVSLDHPHLHAPLGDLKPAEFLQDNKITPAQPIYMLCRGGKRATQAAEAFIAAGHDNVHVIEGGIMACEASGIPLRKGGEVMSLERQVRIAAGLLVVAGVALGALVSPWLYGIAAFVGAGLVFAGVTDSCGMAFVLAKAPWNRKTPKQGGQPASCSAPSTASCGSAASACSAATPAAEDEAVRIPPGTVFYSPGSGKPAPVQVHALTPVGVKAGGCS